MRLAFWRKKKLADKKPLSSFTLSAIESFRRVEKRKTSLMVMEHALVRDLRYVPDSEKDAYIEETQRILEEEGRIRENKERNLERRYGMPVRRRSK